MNYYLVIATMLFSASQSYAVGLTSSGCSKVGLAIGIPFTDVKQSIVSSFFEMDVDTLEKAARICTEIEKAFTDEKDPDGEPMVKCTPYRALATTSDAIKTSGPYNPAKFLPEQAKEVLDTLLKAKECQCPDGTIMASKEREDGVAWQSGPDDQEEGINQYIPKDGITNLDHWAYVGSSKKPPKIYSLNKKKVSKNSKSLWMLALIDQNEHDTPYRVPVPILIYGASKAITCVGFKNGSGL